MNIYKPPLSVYVVWHPQFVRGQRVATMLYNHFAADGSLPGIRRGVGVPVMFRSAPQTSSNMPRTIDLDDSVHTVVVPLVDTHMLREDHNGWTAYFRHLLPQLTNHGSHRLLPVAFHSRARGWNDAFGRTQVLSLRPDASHRPHAKGTQQANRPEHDEEVQNMNLVYDLTHELSRLLLNKPRTAAFSTAVAVSAAPVTLFLSHAKRDGLEYIHQFHAYVNEHLQIKTFFDCVEIAAGSDFSEELSAHVDGSAMLVLLTDYYASRPWCQREILRAKQMGRPLLVIDALNLGEARSFPYLGNTPTIRCQLGEAGFEAAIGHLLREVLRTEHFKLYVTKLKELNNVPADAHALPYPPELLTAVERKKQGASAELYVYPDPPVGIAETTLLADFDSTQQWSTPMQLLSRTTPPGEHLHLHNFAVGLSISGSPDLAERGFSQQHVDDAFAEISRHLLTAGATLCTGHDFRRGGYGDGLIQLAQAYFNDWERPVTPIQSYLPHSAKADQAALEEEYVRLAKLNFAPSPAQPQPERNTDEYSCWVARGLQLMREMMISECNASVFLGGKVNDFVGPLPGVVEEAMLALRARTPVYLVGGFGGATYDLLGLLRQTETRLQEQVYFSDPERETRFTRWNAWAQQHNLTLATLTTPVATPDRQWWTVLNNGLTEDENQRLADTCHIPEIVALILHGLARVAAL